MMNIQNLRSKESIGVKFKVGICAELCLRLWFESNWNLCHYYVRIVLKATLHKESPKHLLPKVSSETVITTTSFKFCNIHAKRNFNTGVFLWILRNVYKQLLLLNTSSGICRSSLLNQKQCGMPCTTKFVDLVWVRYLHITRNHSNTHLLINLQKTKTCPSKALQQKQFFWY